MCSNDTMLALSQVVHDNLDARAKTAPLASLSLLWEGEELLPSQKLTGLPNEATVQLIRRPREECGEHMRVAV
eukprot:2287047-Amphidinium_carterae.1